MYKDIKIDEKAKFLVTGGAGFIGSNLCEKILELGGQVVCLDNFFNGKKENIKNFIKHSNFDLIEGDITSYETCYAACKEVDYVLHQAAWGSVPRSIEMPLEYEKINVQGTLNILEASRKRNVKRVVYASSSSVYGDHPTLPKKEGLEGNVISPYALTKKIDEEYAILYNELYGLETIGMRYFNVFGKKQDPYGDYAAVIPKFVKSLLLNEPPTINGDGKQSRDFTYIDNVIEANLKACTANKEATGKVFNIAFGGQEYLIDMYNKISNLLEKNIDPYFGPERPGDIKHSHADISRAQKLLNYNPSYNFNDGIELTINWYKENIM